MMLDVIEDAVQHAIRLFWTRVSIPADEGACWEWMGSKTPIGYGTITAGRRPNRRYFMAHRLSYEIHYGPIPDGLNVMHSCDNRGCVNPSHLSAGTQKENIHDMYVKGRNNDAGPIGEKNHFAKLSEDDVRYIRSAYVPRSPVHGQQALAERFGLTRDGIHKIVSGQSWKHVK